MDRSTLRLPDPNPVPPNGDRRRAVRQKLHTPVYASFNGPETGLVVDLSELLDLNEGGFAVQTSERLEPNRAVSLCLDLPETRNFIHGSGQVIWSDESGRSGIQFSALSEASRKILKEWLFANLLIACSNHAARTEQLAHHDAQDQEQEKNSTEVETAAVSLATATASQRTSALSSLDEVRVQVRELGDNSAAIFQFITEAAWELTGASGAALALRAQGQRQGLEEDQMTWRAATGAPVPPLGDEVDTEQGLSGECVRGGQLVTCDDMEKDPRIDPEIGRALGIGSLMASPIVSNFRVVGVLEIFSPHAQAFSKVHGTILDRLGELVPKTLRETVQPEIEPEKIQASPMDLIHPMEPVFEARPDPVSESLMQAAEIEVKAAPEPVVANLVALVPEAIVPETIVPEAISDIPASRTGQSIRAALLEKAPEVQEPAVAKEVSPRDLKPAAAEDIDVDSASKQIVGKQTAVAAAAPTALKAKAAAASSSRILHRALFGLAIFVVAIAVGDLIAPLVKKRWPEPSQAAQPSTAKATDGTSSSSSSSSSPVFLKSASDRIADRVSDQHVSDHGAADRGTAEQHPPARSIADLQTLANQGDADAQWQLGLRYHNGEGVAQSDSQAMLWFQMAAEQGHVTAQSALGAYYWVGRGVPKDLSKSYFWSEIAMAQGDDISKSRLEGLSSQMTQGQVSAARQQAEVWIRNHSQRAKSEAN